MPTANFSATDKFRLEMAPMQGLTGYLFRAVYRRHFSGVDHFYSPFVRLRAGKMHARDQRELQAGLAEADRFTPQIIAANAVEAQALAQHLADMGYRRVNLNLGCPYPMETKRKRGAGLLPYPDEVEQVIAALCSFAPHLQVSVKTRLGLENEREFAALIPVFNRFPLTAVIVHPRTAQQMYEGAVNWRLFAEQAAKLSMPVIANGEINSVVEAKILREKNPWISGLMIGRGLLRDPFLPAAIKGKNTAKDRMMRLHDFHQDLFASYQNAGLAPAHLVDKMRPLWPYLADNFEQADKVAKRFRKVRSLEKYQQLVELFFDPQEL